MLLCLGAKGLIGQQRRLQPSAYCWISILWSRLVLRYCCISDSYSRRLCGQHTHYLGGKALVHGGLRKLAYKAEYLRLCTLTLRPGVMVLKSECTDCKAKRHVRADESNHVCDQNICVLNLLYPYSTLQRLQQNLR